MELRTCFQSTNFKFSTRVSSSNRVSIVAQRIPLLLCTCKNNVYFRIQTLPDRQTDTAISSMSSLLRSTVSKCNFFLTFFLNLYLHKNIASFFQFITMPGFNLSSFNIINILLMYYFLIYVIEIYVRMYVDGIFICNMCIYLFYNLIEIVYVVIVTQWIHKYVHTYTHIFI